MPTFRSKLLAPLRSKIVKNVKFALCFVNLIAKVRLRFDLVQISRSTIAELRCASENKKI